jgi:hypothetical protein
VITCKFCEHREHGEERCGVLTAMSMFGPHSYCECDGKADWVERIHGEEIRKRAEEWDRFVGKVGPKK